MEERNNWGGAIYKNDTDAEVLLEILFGGLYNEGYDVVEYKQLNLNTTAYGGIQVTKDGKTFRITVENDF